MIQRAQTIYLLFSVLLCMFTFYSFPLEFEKKELFGIDYQFLFLKYSFLLISLLSLVSIIIYKKRNFQIFINRFSLLLISFIITSFLFFNTESFISFHYKILSSAFINFILIILANKSILKDKKLIDSINRLR